MDKQQFVEQVINEVRSLAVSSVLSTRMELIFRGGYNKGLCPFHHDRKIGSFVATDRKQVWKCFSCGVGGDSIKFIALSDNINYLQSAFDIALDFGIISQSDYDEYFTRRRYKKEDIRKIERRYEEMDKVKWENNIADPEVLDAIFSAFIDSCSLSDTHKAHLINERGLTEKEIEDGKYFTFPTRRMMSSFSMKIRQQFQDEEVLSRIPGFYKDLSTNLYVFARHKGIGIGIQNAKGQIVGIQIRHDEKKDKSNRYVWFSSSFAMYDNEKYDCGTSSGSPVDVVYPDEITNTTVVITEGRFKAQQIAKHYGSIAISVQGVSSWKGIVRELEALPFAPTVKQRYKKGNVFRINCVCVAFDADMNYKVQVFQQLRAMTNQLEANGMPVYYLNWNEKFGKGIDDVILAGNRREIKRYEKEVWDKQYDEMLKILLDNEEYAEMKDVPEEVVQKYFYEHMNVKPLEPNQTSVKHQKRLAK